MRKQAAAAALGGWQGQLLLAEILSNDFCARFCHIMYSLQSCHCERSEAVPSLPEIALPLHTSTVLMPNFAGVKRSQDSGVRDQGLGFGREAARWLLLGLLLSTFFWRLQGLTVFPGFVDEGTHVQWARGLWQGLFWLFPLAHGRWLPILYLGFFAPMAAPLWVARAAIVLVSLLTPMALYRLGMLLFQNRLLAFGSAFVYVSLPFAFFHDRLALVDSFTALLGTLAALQIVRLTHSLRSRRRTRAILFTSLLLAATVLSKINASGILGFPLLAVWLLTSKNLRRPTLLRAGLITFGGVLGAFIPGGFKSQVQKVQHDAA